MKKLYWIETISSHTMYYAIEAETKPNVAELEKRLNKGTVPEVSQRWHGEQIALIKEITIEDYLQLFDAHVETFRDWNTKEKLNQITNLDESVKIEEENG